MEEQMEHNMKVKNKKKFWGPSNPDLKIHNKISVSHLITLKLNDQDWFYLKTYLYTVLPNTHQYV